jgi:hypothetical protein
MPKEAGRWACPGNIMKRIVMEWNVLPSSSESYNKAIIQPEIHT